MVVAAIRGAYTQAAFLRDCGAAPGAGFQSFVQQLSAAGCTRVTGRMGAQATTLNTHW
jgi:hypothetical protein